MPGAAWVEGVVDGPCTGHCTRERARAPPRSPGVVLRLIGVAAVLCGGAVFVVVVWRFLLYTGDGGTMNDPGGAWTITWVALLTVAAGITILTVARKREPEPRS